MYHKVSYVQVSNTDRRVCDVWEEVWWSLNKLATPLSSNIITSINKNSIWLCLEVDNGIVWTGDASSRYTITSRYHWLHYLEVIPPVYYIRVGFGNCQP